jgi:serine/threonine-protein kinase
VGVVNVTGDHHAELLLHGPQSENNGDISPDGKWLAYDSDESKQAEIYVRPFPNVEGGRQQASTGGGTRPLWARSGRELFYDVGTMGASSAKIMAVSVQPGTTLTFGTPQVVVDGRYLTPQAGRTYDVSRDGKRFLMIKDATPPTSSSAPTPSQLVVVLNWTEELKARVPAK